MYCTNCGASMSEGSFCANCGRKQESGTARTVVEEARPETPVKKPRVAKRRNVLIGGVAIAVLGGAGIAGAVALASGSMPSSTDSGEPGAASISESASNFDEVLFRKAESALGECQTSLDSREQWMISGDRQMDFAAAEGMTKNFCALELEKVEGATGDTDLDRELSELIEAGHAVYEYTEPALIFGAAPPTVSDQVFVDLIEDFGAQMDDVEERVIEINVSLG